jgi:DtxR family transcriptional regulator, Mn-dependent transcriptional regulator
MQSQTEENYLKAIYKLAEKQGGKVNTNALAEKLNTKASSVTDMIKRLADKQLVDYEKYQGVGLTKKGEAIAIQIIRKHRLWEYFLVHKLGFKWDKVHEIAEELEHIYSEELIDKLDAFLGCPQYDPHGDPIPNKEGKFTKHQSFQLDLAQQGDKVLITGVIDHSPNFLQYLEQHGLELGTLLEIKTIADFDKSIALVLNGEKDIFVSHQVAKNLLVVKN